MLSTWARSKLEAVGLHDRVLMRDPLGLLSDADGNIHAYARENAFTVIVCATNLVFRELYEKSLADPGIGRLLVIDRAPARRRVGPSTSKAPPPFYPDLLELVPESARVDLDLRQYLKEKTGDPNWPAEANDPRFARLVAQHLEGVLQAHRNLRTADRSRFSDHDFKTIVAYAALRLAGSAFKNMKAKDYWRIGLLSHDELIELESLAPEITKPIIDELAKAPAPFSWFAKYPAETVLRAFYLSVILSQHFEHWNLLLAKIDSSLASLDKIKPQIFNDAAPELIDIDPKQAARDIEEVEASLSKESLTFLLLEQIDLAAPDQFSAVIEKERYSTLLRSLALLLALDNLVSRIPAAEVHKKITSVLSPEQSSKETCFVERRSSVVWTHLRNAYELASQCLVLKEELNKAIKSLKVLKTDQLTYGTFQTLWNDQKINRLEYSLSALERLVGSGDFLPRAEEELPSAFSNALSRIRLSVRTMADETQAALNEMNLRFQEMVVSQYSDWTKNDGEVRLTNQFIRRCLKPNWDPQKEKAVLFIFDGLRYDIWDEFLRPMFEDRMQIVKEYPACSLLPSETHITRKAISAGAFADEFDSRQSEGDLLKAALKKEFGYAGDVEVVPPDSMGTGETVRYRAGNLDVMIFELCDKELHKIQNKTLPDGREVPARPLAFIYQQHIKNIIDTEVMGILRGLEPGTKVFITADHGFGRIPRERVRIDAGWLNEATDCMYLNCWLRETLATSHAPAKVRENVWELPLEKVRLPLTQSVVDPKSKASWQKKYASVIFPKTGFALSRPGANFNPDAYSHGGISVQELMIPMVVMVVRPKDEGLISVEEISGPTEIIEGQDAEFRVRLGRSGGKSGTDEIRVDVEASYSADSERDALANMVLYVSAQGAEAVYRFKPNPDDATVAERSAGLMERVLAITITYRDGRRKVRKSRTHRFGVRLNSEQVIRRVPPHLGNILGLTPKTMR